MVLDVFFAILDTIWHHIWPAESWTLVSRVDQHRRDMIGHAPGKLWVLEPLDGASAGRYSTTKMCATAHFFRVFGNLGMG